MRNLNCALFKPFRLILWTLALGTFAGAGLSSARAEDHTELPGFHPTVLANDTIAQKIYDSMGTAKFKSSSGCFQRAHNWAYALDRQQNIKSMKVFLFFTSRYQREFDYHWFYHVAPVIPVQTDLGLVDKVFDPTFTSAPPWATASEKAQYDAKPLSVQEWTRYFIFPEGDCPEVKSYSDFADYQERFYCYTIKTPMYTYIPDTIEFEQNHNQQPASSWSEDNLKQMEKAKN